MYKTYIVAFKVKYSTEKVETLIQKYKSPDNLMLPAHVERIHERLASDYFCGKKIH